MCSLVLTPCCSSKLGKHLGALEQQPQGHGLGGRGGPLSGSQQDGEGTGGDVPHPSSLCSTTCASIPGEGYLSGPFADPWSWDAGHIWCHVQLPTTHPSQCPATGCSAASSCTQPSSSHPLIRPRRSMLLYRQHKTCARP